MKGPYGVKSNRAPLLAYSAALIFLVFRASLASAQALPAAAKIWAEIRVIDAATGRGIPLVELETVNSIKYVTDNPGRVAFYEPGQMGREVFFSVRSHGYESPKDAFGIVGVRLTPKVGEVGEIKLTRRNLAERLCRLTGEGLYRDSIMLGQQPPLPESAHPGQVAGQDSIQAVLYRKKAYYFWGDTLRMSYPLGLFRMAGATTSIPNPADPRSDPVNGIAYDYFTDKKTGFARAMMPLSARPQGVVWIGGVFVVPDEKDAEKLVGHYSRRKGLADELEQGIAVFDDKKAIFEPVMQLDLSETWRRPAGHPIAYEEGGKKWILFGSPTPNVRVPATLRDVLDPMKYEAFTCAKAVAGDKRVEPETARDGKPVWRWQKELPPTDSNTENLWVKTAKLKPEFARFCPADVNAPADRLVLHSGTVRWNDYRKKWVLVAGQFGGKSSLLGEVWYAEASAPTGPFSRAVKIVTHDRQTFYNVCHHGFMDREGGRLIHFEGTYTNDFSGNPEKTQRYNYNQVLYRLDLSSAGLHSAEE